MGDVRSLNAARADRENNNTLISPVECLEDAASGLRGGRLNAEKALVLLLDSGEDGDAYNVHFLSSNLRVSEMVSLLEAAKTRLLQTLVPA